MGKNQSYVHLTVWKNRIKRGKADVGVFALFYNIFIITKFTPQKRFKGV